MRVLAFLYIQKQFSVAIELYDAYQFDDQINEWEKKSVP